MSQIENREVSDREKGRPPIPIIVNEQDVMVEEPITTGAEIKAAAIAHGVLIQHNFMLMEELPNGTSRNIRDDEKVKLRPHMKFTAIAPDDNS